MPYGTPHLEGSRNLKFFNFFSWKEFKTDHFKPIPIVKFVKMRILDDFSDFDEIPYSVCFFNL